MFATCFTFVIKPLEYFLVLAGQETFGEREKTLSVKYSTESVVSKEMPRPDILNMIILGFNKVDVFAWTEEGE